MPQRVVIDAKFEIPVILDGKEIIKVVNKKLLENSEMHMIYLFLPYLLDQLPKPSIVFVFVSLIRENCKVIINHVP